MRVAIVGTNRASFITSLGLKMGLEAQLGLENKPPVATASTFSRQSSGARQICPPRGIRKWFDAGLHVSRFLATPQIYTRTDACR